MTDHEKHVEAYTACWDSVAKMTPEERAKVEANIREHEECFPQVVPQLDRIENMVRWLVKYAISTTDEVWMVDKKVEETVKRIERGEEK